MKKQVFLLTFLAVCISSFAQQPWKQKSLFWEISGNGLKKPCYLYGTMHVSSKMAFHLTDSFFVAMQKADAIGIESRPEEWLEGMFNSDLITSYYGMGQNRYDDYYGSKKDNTFYDLAFKNDIPKREDFAGLMALDPFLINGILYRSFQMSQDFEEDTYLDMFLYQCAKKLGKETYSMENFSESMKMEILAESKRYEDEKEEVNSTEEEEVLEEDDDLAYGYGRKDKMEEAYRIGDLAAIDSISKKNSKSFYKYMLVERNKLMLHTFDSIAQSGKSLLAGVGAAHLPGDEGLLQLLMNMGYTVRPMKSNDAKPSKMKEKMDDMKAPLTMKPYLLEEENLEVYAPNKFYKFPTSTASSFYLSFDMANGSFFIVNTMPTYGIWEGRSQEYILEQVDSLIYEYVAGKLISHERITNNLGYPGIKVVSKTRRGDIQKYCFFVGPQKLYSFKVSGNGDFADRKDAIQFIDDINFKPKNNSAYSMFTPKHGKYEVLLPENREYSLSPLGFRFSHQGEKITAYDAKKDILFGLTKAVLYDNEFIEEDTFELSYLLKTFAKQHDAEVLSQQFIPNATYPELEGVLKRKNRYIHAKIAIDANQYYLLYGISDKNERPDEVFNSFKILPGAYLNGIVETDTTLKYKVKIIANSERYKTQDFVSYEDISNAYDANTSHSFYYEEDDQESDERYFEKWIMSDNTGEFVQVIYDKYSKYFWEDTTLQNRQKYDDDYFSYDRNNRTNIDSIGERKIQSFTNVQGDSCRDRWYVRNGSRRIIWEREIVHGNTKYWLSTVLDSVSGANDFQKVFFETFEPLRPAEAFDFFADKSPLILTDIYAEDSTIFKTARYGLEIAPSTFAKNNFKELVSAIQNSRFNDLSFEDKETLINALAHHPKEPTAFAILDSIYNNAGDTSAYQLWVLETLSDMKTKEAVAKFVNLIMEETPLLGDREYGSSYHAMFNGLKDSIELVVPHLADLMELTRIPDYKDIILDLAAETVVETKVNPEIFKSFKVFLTHEAKNELKRGNLVTENDIEDDIKPNPYGYYGSDFGYEDYDEGYHFNKNYDTIPLEKRKIYPRDELGNCLVLLALMKDEPQVKTFLEKVINAKSETPNKSNYLAILEKAGIPVKDSVWKRLSQSKSYRLDTYAYLKKLDKLDKFDKTYLNRDSLVFSYMYETLESDKDSIVYVGAYPAANMYYNGEVVVYKRKSVAAKKWKVDMAFVTYDEKKPLDFNIEYVDKDNEVKNDKEKIQKKIEEFKETILLKGRERAYESRY
ncbi:MAG: TraB/GumN family protein [Chitinophagales bacterium]|nr:TraB/GumN family protein [Chitinophagales bacterium]